MNNTEAMATPAKKAKRDNVKEEELTPASARSLKIDMENSSLVASPATSSARRLDDEEELVEKFWRESGIECAAEIASRLASSAVQLAARYTMQQMALERRTAEMKQLGRAELGKVGWPRRKLPGTSGVYDIPATWRTSPAYSRRAAALATPPRRCKRKNEDDAFYPDLLGIAPITPMVNQLKANAFQGELAALSRLDNKARIGRAKLRRERKMERFFKRAVEEEVEDETSSDGSLPELVEHVGHGCEHDLQSSSSDEDDTAISNNATMGNVNVNIVCNH